MRRMVRALFLFAMVFAASLAEAASFQIVTVSGDVTFNDKPVKVRDTVSGQGIFKTGAGASAKIFSKEARTITILKENSEIEVAASSKVPGSFKLVAGMSRWVVGKVRKNEPVVVTTKSAVMGVRGTEFIAIYNPLLDETEIVSFDGEIEFRNKQTPKDRKMVKANQWGGLGGRFGQSIGDILDLPPNVITHFKTATDLATALPGSQASDEFHGHQIPK